MGARYLVALSALLASKALACAPAGSTDTSEQTTAGIAASSASQSELGVERWQIAHGENSTTVSGLDGDDGRRAEVGFRGIDIDGIHWVQVTSATTARGTFLFRVDENDSVLLWGADSIQKEPAAWRAAALANADIQTNGSDAPSLARSSIGPLSKGKLINQGGACLVFVGDVLTSVGSATGNDAVTACGAACGQAGNAMSCYNNYK